MTLHPNVFFLHIERKLISGTLCSPFSLIGQDFFNRLVELLGNGRIQIAKRKRGSSSL